MEMNSKLISKTLMIYHSSNSKCLTSQVKRLDHRRNCKVSWHLRTRAKSSRLLEIGSKCLCSIEAVQIGPLKCKMILTLGIIQKCVRQHRNYRHDSRQ